MVVAAKSINIWLLWSQRIAWLRVGSTKLRNDHAALNIDVLIDAGYSSTSPDYIGDKESKRLPRIPG
jgi:hypothetical protein